MVKHFTITLFFSTVLGLASFSTAFAQKNNAKTPGKSTPVTTKTQTDKKPVSSAESKPENRESAFADPDYVPQVHKYLVYVDPADHAAMYLFQNLGVDYKDIKVEPLNWNNWYYVGGASPNMVAFKRMLGGYFTIFSEDDFNSMREALPCMAEIKPVLEDLERKLFK